MGDRSMSVAKVDTPALERAPAPRPVSFRERTFAALQHPNYRLWFMGQLMSMVGTWMQITAQSFLVYELTQSTAYLGFVGFANGLPSMVLMLYGGVVADRVARRKLLVFTQSTMMLLAVVLAVLTFTRLVQPWHIVLLALALGTANAFDAPASQAFVFDLVDRKDVTNAVALNATLFNLATVIGPTVAGLTYAAFGGAWCFAINAVSFLGVITALLLMRLPAHAPAAVAASGFVQLKEGVRYTFAHPLLRYLILIPAFTSLFGMSYMTLLPAWSVDVMGGNAATNGLLQSARGAGSLIGALMLAALAHHGQRGRWLTVSLVVYGMLMFAFAAARWLPLTMLVLVGVGWAGGVLFNSANTLLQSHVSDALRGRVMAIYTLTFFGGIPLGALWAGPLAAQIGAPSTLMVSSGLMFIFALVFWLRVPEIRRLS